VETHLDEQGSIIGDFVINILTITSTAISIAKFNGSNYKQWSGEMALLLEQKQVYGRVTGEDQRPEDPAEQDATAAQKLAHRAAVNDWVKQHGTAGLMIQLGMEPRQQASYKEITDAWTLWEKLATAYKAKLKFNVIQIREERLGIRLEDCDDADTYALRIDQKVKYYNECSEPSRSSSGTIRTLAKMTDEERVFYLLRGIPRNDNWQFFLELMMDKNATATLTPDEIVIKLVEKQATIKRENGLGQEALLFAKGNGKGNAKGNAKGKGKGNGRKSRKGDESDEDQDRKGKPTCFYCHKEGHKVWNCQSMKRSDPPVAKESTETTAKAMDDTITTARDSVEMTTIIENYWVTDTTGGKTAPSKESWYLDCASTSHVCGDQRMFARYTGFTKKDEREIRDFAGKVAGRAIGQGDVRFSLRLPGYCRIDEVVVRDVLHVAGAHNSLSQSRLMDRGLRIVPVNGYGIKIYENLGQGSLVAVAPQVGGLCRFDVVVARKGRQSRDVSRDKQYTAPNTISNEHTYTDILEPEEPKTPDISVPVASTGPAINSPAAGCKPGGNSAGQLKDRTGSSDEHYEDESEDQDEDDPLVAIDKSKTTSLTWELAGLDGNLGRAWEAPAGCHRRSRTDHGRWRSGRLEIESAEAN